MSVLAHMLEMLQFFPIHSGNFHKPLVFMKFPWMIVYSVVHFITFGITTAWVQTPAPTSNCMTLRKSLMLISVSPFVKWPLNVNFLKAFMVNKTFSNCYVNWVIMPSLSCWFQSMDFKSKHKNLPLMYSFMKSKGRHKDVKFFALFLSLTRNYDHYIRARTENYNHTPDKWSLIWISVRLNLNCF